MRVDLPAPFSPQIACTVPRSTCRVTSCSALTPGKVFVMPRISRIVSAMPLLSVGVLPDEGPRPRRWRGPPSIGSGSGLLEVAVRVVAAVDQDLLVVVLGD